MNDCEQYVQTATTLLLTLPHAAVSRMNMNPSEILMKEFDYSLPAPHIATHPLPNRDESRLLIYKKGNIQEDIFKNVGSHLPSPSQLLLNNTRVIEARILFQKHSGGVIEIFCLEPSEQAGDMALAMAQKSPIRWNCFIGGASKWKPGQLLEKELEILGRAVKLTARYVQKRDDCFVIEFSWLPESFCFGEILNAAGAIPLPPYIKREVTEADAERYQTIFAAQQGSVAAPTAALHFTEEILDALRVRGIQPAYITLHVGAGTFKPVKSETIAEHQMHGEYFHASINTLNHLINAERIIAVGTTSLRTLESLYWIGVKLMKEKNLSPAELVLSQWEAYEIEAKNISYTESLEAIIQYLRAHQLEELFCRTSLLIVPGYQFKSAEALITNFHQPQSTLLLLVAAFIGEDWKKVYEHALNNNFRFLSYGDSSLLWRAPKPSL